jgi:VWFA-related protein
VEKFLGRDNGALSHPVLLAFLSDAGLKLSDPSQDGNALTAELNANQAGLRVVTRNQGVYGAGERLHLSLNAVGQLIQAEGVKPGRKLVVWISPGWPILTGPGIQLSPRDRQGIFQNIVVLSDGLRKADMTISSIDPLGAADAAQVRTFFWKSFVNGVKKPDDAQYGNLALPVLAFQSGGRVLNSSNDVASEIAAAVSDVDIYYVLKFQASSAEAANQYHSIEVKLDKPGLTVHTRSGYYAQP